MIYLIVILYLNFLLTLSSSLSAEQNINEEFINVKNLKNFHLYNSLSLEENRSSIAWSRLHSTQLNTTLLNKNFKLTNKTIITLSKETNREMLCQSIKSCHLSTNTYQCILDLNMIIYLNPSINTTSHFNQIKLFKLNVILSDFTNDYLTFDKLAYEFVFNLNIEYGDVHEFGSVKASTSNENFDLNNLIKYYLDFNTNDRIDLIDLIKIDETTGSLLINRTKLITKLYKSKYEFYVDAFIQCSSNQKQLQNRTLISLYLVNDKQTKPSVNMINLVESITLNSIECLKIKNDFSSYQISTSTSSLFTSIALAQIQIDNFYEINNLKFEYDNQLNHLDNNYYSIKFEHLIDNIYIIYLIINNSLIQQNQANYLIDIKKFHFKISNTKFSFKSQIYVCLNVQTDQELYEELSLVQFRQNYLILNSQTNEFTLNADYLGTWTKLNFILDPTIENKHVILSDQTNNSVKVKFESLFHKKNNIELLQNEIIILAYDSNIPEGKFSKIYTYLKQMSLTHKSNLKFASKIIVNNHIEQLEVFKPNQHEFKFNLSKNKLINNSIIGYLPNIHELVQLYENRIENYYYKFSQEQECFRLTKFDGVLYYKQCLNLNLNNTIRLDIDLVNSKDEKLTFKNIYQIEISLNITIDEQEQVINLYTNETLLDLTLSYELNLNVLNTKTHLPKYLKLANIISDNENKKFSLVNVDHNLNDQFKYLIILDTKSNQIYLNITNFYEQNPTILFNKCVNFKLDSKHFQYINSIKRILKSNQIYDLNFCLFINKYQSELIRPVIGSHYEYLVKNQTLNISFLWLGFICLFLASSIFLISTTAYLCYKKNLINSKISSKNNDDKSSSFARFEVSSKYSSSLDSFSQTSQCELKIRNDENTDSELYQVFSYNYDERVVPTKLDILLNKKPLSAENSQFVELSSIKQSSEDQGVYCLATGTSFTSNFSSVSNSECVDLDHDDLSMNKCFKLNNIKHNDQNDVEKIEKTRLSLFEMTPFKVRQCSADYEVRQIFASNEYLIKNWIQTNSNNLSFQTSSSVSATNECII